MEEHINPTILDNFEANCPAMDMKRAIPQGVLRSAVDNANIQFMNIHSRDQEYIDHTLLGPEYIGNAISNSFMIDLMDEEQHDPSGQASADCPINALGSGESFPSEAQLHTILQFVNRQGHIRNQQNINIVESSNDHLITHSDKEMLESEFLAMHGNLLNDQNFKLFCSQQIIPIQEGLNTDLSVNSLPSLPEPTPLPIVTPTPLPSWPKKESTEETHELLGTLGGATTKKVLPHKKRISKKLKNLDRNEESNYDQTVSPESPPRVNRYVVSNGSQFECELCGAISETQVQFFSHLKGHYEPNTIKETETVMQRIPADSIIAAVDDLEPKQSNASSAAVVQDHQVFNEVELNFDNFSEVVELSTQEHHHEERHHESNHNANDIKIIDSHSIADYMAYVVQTQEPQQVVGNVHEEVEFSDTEDMLEGIRGVVDKVSIDDTSNDMDLHPRNISKESWFSSSAFNGIAFKEEIITNDDFEKRTAFMPMVKNENDDDHHPPINSNEYNTEDFNDTTQEPSSSEVNDSTIENTNIKRRGRPRNAANKRTPKAPQTDDDDDDDENSEEFLSNNKKRYICTKCNREFNSCNALKYHNLSHTGERPHQCEVCGKSFFAQSALKSHMRLHTGDKPYECEQCHRKFRQWSDLNYHIVSIHSDVKNYTCEFCGKSFSRKYSLVIHRRIHTSERNYKCEFCSKSFRASSYLQNHRKIHTGEKPHSCPTCGKKFRMGGDLRRHMKTHERKATNEPNSINVEVPVQSKNSNISKLDDIDIDIKNDVLLKIEYQKESKDELLFLDKMASKINHLFKTEADFVNEDLENTDLSFVT